MRRTLVRIEDIASPETLNYAAWRAALGHRTSKEVQSFLSDLPRQVERLSTAILKGDVVVGNFRKFVIKDPKERLIHAPPFSERVLHHAMMHWIEPILERPLVPETFACRREKGSLLGVRSAQHHLRRHPWYVKVDVKKYFDSIDHEKLLRLLERRIRGPRTLALCERVVRCYSTAPGKGLPIGALTSQHFANTYLEPFDRWLREVLHVRAAVRYMDDVVWWSGSKEVARQELALSKEFLRDRLSLDLKSNVQIHRSDHGLSYLGFRIFRGMILLSLRRRRRYAKGRRRLEAAFERGEIGAAQLKKGYSAVHAVTLHADSKTWRSEQLRRVPGPEL